MGESIWKTRLFYSLYFLAFINLLVGTERLAFDVLGQMWITLALNALTVLTSILGIIGIFFRRKTAVIAYIVCAIIVVGVNLIIILIYNDVAIFSKKEHYLSLTLSNNNYWRTRGFLCYQVCGNSGTANTDTAEDMASGNFVDGTLLVPDDPDAKYMNYGSGAFVYEEACFVTYAIIESVHAASNTAILMVSVLLSFVSLCFLKSDSEKRSEYETITGQYGGKAQRKRSKQGTFYKLSDSFDAISNLKLSSHSSSM